MGKFPPLTRIPSLSPKLEDQLERIRAALSGSPIHNDLVETLVIGSVSRGEATYRSDIDLLMILRDGPLNFSRVQRLRASLEEALTASAKDGDLPVQAQFVLVTVRATEEPAMKSALSNAWSLWKNREAA